jgi:PEGA domain
MRKFIIVLLLFCMGIMFGATFKVTRQLEKLEHAVVRGNVRDTDGEYCAKLQVNSDIKSLQFDSNRKPVKQEKDVGKYYVYLSPGERSMTFIHPDFAAFEYEFPITLEANNWYEMTIVQSGYGSADEGMVTLTFELNENNVYISRGDNPPMMSKQQSAQYRLLPGEYVFRFFKSGFNEVEREINVTQDDELRIDLEKGTSSTKMKLPGIVVIDSQPEGAEVYLNDQKVGNTPWQDELIAGEYKLTLKADLHHTKEQQFSVREGETLELLENILLPKYGYIEVNCNQQQAKIYLDGIMLGNGNIPRQKIESSNHKLSVKLDYYHDHEEEFLINDGDEKNLEIILKPAFGRLEIKSTPVDDADVYINGEYAGKTPYKHERMLSGQYRIKVEKELYGGSEETVVVIDEELTQKTILLTQNFGVLNVQAAGCQIFVDSKLMGNNKYKANLSSGNYLVEAKKDRHHPASQKVYLGVGTEEQVILEPEPIMGAVSVMSNPQDSKGAAIWINGEKEKKTTPAVLPLLIGDYNIKVHHPNYLEQTRFISLQEGNQEKLVFNLETYQGSMLSRYNSWKRNGWLGMGSTALVVGAGFLFNMIGDGYADDYKSGTNTGDVTDAWNNMESSYNMRDYSFYVSAAPAIFMVYSWIQAGKYGKQIEKK